MWKVSRSDGQSKIKTTKELIKNKKYKFIPVLTSPVLFANSQTLPIDPYVLGLLLGDGSFFSNVRFTTADKCLLDELLKLAPSHWSLGAVQCNNRTPTYGINKAITDLRELGLADHRSETKFVPEQYLCSTPEQRLAIVQGLLDTDGWVQKGVAKFSSTSRQLVHAMRDLVGSLGGVSHVCERKKKRTANELTEYIVTIRLPQNMKPFRLQRKLNKVNFSPKRRLVKTITKIETVGKDQMQCIKVTAEDSLYVTNNYTLTHNTTGWGWDLKKKTDKNKILQLVFYNTSGQRNLGLI